MDLPIALNRLVDRGVLDRSQADAVLAEMAAPPGPSGLRSLLGEIAGYLGASFVVGATLLLLGEQWEPLGRTGRFAVLAAMAVILFGVGLSVRRSGGGLRRRLSSTLMTGAAAATGFAAYVLVDRSAAPFAGSATALAVVVAGYLLARTALGQLGVAVAAVASYAAALQLLDLDGPVALGVGMLLLGVLWAGLGRRLVTERRFAVAIAVTLGLAGAQTVVLADHPATNLLAYALTALVVGCCFAAYAWMREWIVLAGGVAGATVVVPEALYDVTGGSLGASGVMLAAGVTLLVGGVLGSRIRHDPASFS